MALLFFIGRILVGGYFIYNGYNHLANSGMLAGYAGSKKVPYAKTGVIVSGLLFLVGGFSLLLWIEPVVGAGLLVLTLIPITIMIHDYWKSTDPAHRMGERVAFLKNIALIGMLLMLMGLASFIMMQAY